MSEEVEGPEDPGAASAADPAAMALGLGAASRAKADAYLDDQRAMLHLQMEEMRQRYPYELSHFRLRRFSDLAKAAFEFSAGLLAVALVGGIALMVWYAAHADGLIVESFAVPPELAEKGLSGQVVAGQLTDRLTAMQAATSSARAARSYANNWGDDIKVEIPETGVSIGEAWRFLKNSLGHETHVSGEVWKTDSGIAIAARVSGAGSSVITGAAGDLDSLTQKMAEDIYGRTQPYRFASYLAGHGRPAEALVLFKSLALSGPASERGWGYVGWSNLVRNNEGPAEVARLLKAAMEYGQSSAAANLSGVENNLGHVEAARMLTKKARDMTSRDPGMAPAQVALFSRQADALLAANVGDYATTLKIRKDLITDGLVGTIASRSNPVAGNQINLHDLAGARETLENPLPSSGIDPVGDQLARIDFDVRLALAAEDWAGADAADQAERTLASRYPGLIAIRRTSADPQSAVVAARMGKFAKAEALLRPMPADCYQCSYSRARVADLEGQQGRADWWFAHAVALAPSFPLAEEWWGRNLLARKQPDAAIAQFSAAVKKGPHFADALEGWGEALMAKNQSHLAVEKFAEAGKYAPNWGRLHLKWGEALTYAGKSAEAKAQFSRAAALDLTPSEKSELSKAPHG